MIRRIFLSLLLLVSVLSLTNAQPTQPVELGKVQWLRDLDQGLQQATQENKPVFLLFQEVPGCMTCQRYGSQVLSHPLIVEAIEEYFVPVAIYNNKKGKDAEVLAYYKEPSWNNPVVRIVNAYQANVVPRLSGDYSPLGVVNRMVDAIRLQRKEPPAYLTLLQEEWQAQAKGTAQTTLSMYCFWTGEKSFGQLPGVIATEPGFMDGREVVQVTYDPKVVSFEQVVHTGQRAQCADRIYVHDDQQAEAAQQLIEAGKIRKKSSFRPDGEPKYYLSKTPYRAVPMTALQATRANALIGQGKSPASVLSPRQMAIAQQLMLRTDSNWENYIGKDIVENWEW
jgi:hypothetical protein